MKIPPNATSVSQPADATWNGPLKTRLRNRWIEDLREQLVARVPGQSFKLEPPDRRQLCSWVNFAWGNISPTTITGGFKKCGFLSTNDNDAEEEHVQAEDASDIVAKATRTGLLDELIGEFTLDDDFDDMLEDIACLN
ncbi:hypothetical protein DVH05_014138 [Phytophthora capsici]|nr:hypothetical protein DVH05_014138 [Phytophthora capsici]